MQYVVKRSEDGDMLPNPTPIIGGLKRSHTTKLNSNYCRSFHIEQDYPVNFRPIYATPILYCPQTYNGYSCETEVKM